MKTRVLVLEQHSYWGGGQRVLRTVLNSLREQIHPLVALPEMGTVGSDLERDGIETCTYPLGRYRSGKKSVADMAMFGPRSLHSALRLAALISRRKLDLVYINASRCLAAGVLAARLAGRPSVFCLHQTLSRRTEIALASWLARHVSCIVACSQAAANSLQGAHPGLARKLRVLYPPVDDLPPVDAGRSVSRKPFGITAGMVGRITEAKGHHVLLAALARLDGAGRAVFVGAPAPGSHQDDVYLRRLQAMAGGYGVEVEWSGYHADPTPYYSAMDVLVVASTGEEGLPLVALEALQRGIPVVASRLGGLPELVRDRFNGVLVPPGDIGALARALEEFARDRALLSRLGAQARLSIDERFSKASYCNAIEGIISGLCRAKASLQPAPAWREI